MEMHTVSPTAAPVGKNKRTTPRAHKWENTQILESTVVLGVSERVL